MKLNLYAPGPGLACSISDRIIAGVALPYGAEGRTSAGNVTVDAGAVTVPGDLKRVKLFRDHGRTSPVGYTLQVDDTPQVLSMTFRAAATPDGDTALLEAAEGVRDALSVELDDVVIKNGHVTAATLTAVALVAIPAFADARLQAADTPTEQETEMTDLAAVPEASPAPTAPSTAPADPPAPDRLNASFRGAPRQLTASAAIETIRASLRGASDASQVNAALSDVIPANDTGPAYLRPSWLGELWNPVAVKRNYIPSIQNQTLTTGTKVQGWKWATRPVVGDYAGNKTAIPSNPVSIVPAEAPIWRLAGGWDVDRLYYDLGEAGFLEALFSAAVADYAVKSQAKVAAALRSNSTTVSAATLAEGLAAIGAELAQLGTVASFIGIAPDLWIEFLNLSASDVPWWIPGSSSVSLQNNAAGVGDLALFADASLPAGVMLGGARQAATYFEATPAPLRVQAVNIPNGGIDIAVFGYGAVLVNDIRGIVAVTVGGAGDAPAATGRNK